MSTAPRSPASTTSWGSAKTSPATSSSKTGLHLTSGALNQAALARDRAGAAAACWIVSAVLFVAWMLSPAVSDELLRTEIGYVGATLLLAGTLALLYRQGSPRSRAGSAIPAT